MLKDMNSGSNMSLFIPLFKNQCDYEISSIIISWLSNGWEIENHIQNNLLLNVMKPSPTQYVLNFDFNKEEINPLRSMVKTLTYGNFENLIVRTRDLLVTYGSIKKAYLKHQVKRNKNKYVHETFATMLGGDTGFQTKTPNCTFYRYNLLFYLLAYKHKIWDVDTSNALLPCNDQTFACALKKGIIKKKMKSTLDNTIILTEIAKKKYGDDFYKLLNDIRQ